MWRLTLCLFFVTVLNVSARLPFKDGPPKIEVKMKKFGVVPDLISSHPALQAEVQFVGFKASLGNTITPESAKYPPKINWLHPNPKSYYALCMLDLDCPSKKDPIHRSFLHWLVVNIEGSNVVTGKRLADYVCPLPADRTGLHRYVILIYKQPSKLMFDEPHLSFRESPESRHNFSIHNFTQKYFLGDPIAGNFFMARYQKFVDRVLRKFENED